MNKPRLISGVLTVALWTTVIVLQGIRAKRSGEFGWFITSSLLAVAAVGVIIAVLYAMERFLAKRKSPRWMSGFHVCMAIAFAIAITVLVVYVLMNYA